MRSLLLSSIIIGLMSVFAAPALADDGWQSHNQTATAYLTNATDQGAIVPVVRYYSYYGGPGWYGYRYYPRYRAYYSPYYYSYPYQTYVYPGPTYGYGYYPPSDFYYHARRGRLGFVY
jgi:hypothetical protein